MEPPPDEPAGATSGGLGGFLASKKKLLMYLGGVALVVGAIVALRSASSGDSNVPSPAGGANIPTGAPGTIAPAVVLQKEPAKLTPKPIVVPRRSPIETPLGVEVSRQVRRLAGHCILQTVNCRLQIAKGLTGLPEICNLQSTICNPKGPPAVVAQGPAPTPTPAPIKYRECPPGIRLSGIIACSDGAYACLNDRMVKVGGVVNGAKVVAVRDFTVEMELDGERFIVGIGTGMPERPSEPAEDASADDDKPAAKPPTPASRPAEKSDASDSSKKPKHSNTSKKVDRSSG